MPAADEEVKQETEEGEEEDLSSQDVINKYQEAARAVNLSLQGIVQQCVAGAKIVDLCQFGDTVINQRCAQIFRNKVKGVAIEKGVAFPTCISVNECICHNNPLASEADQQPPLEDGDIVKIDLGCHVDGYIAVAAHTVKVGQDKAAAPLTGKEADVILSCHAAAEVASRAIAVGSKNTDVIEAVKKVAESYGTTLIAGTLMHQMKRYVIDGSKVITLQDNAEKVDDFEFEPNEVYAVDVAVSGGEGKPRESSTRTTVFKRAVDKNYRLKMKSSRYLLNEVNSRFPTLPFCLRALEDERQARMGVVECMNHELLQPYPVLYEKQGDAVAHFKFTVLLLPSGTTKITGLDFQYESYSSEHKLDPETQAVLDAAALKQKKKAKKKKAKSK